MIVIERAVGVLVLGVTRHVVERYMLLQLWLASLWYTRYRAPRMSYVGGARAFIRRRASRGSLERLGCAPRARAHGEHGAGDLVEVRGGLLGEVHVGEPRRNRRVHRNVDPLRRPVGPLGVLFNRA